jgi:hypothetical protein
VIHCSIKGYGIVRETYSKESPSDKEAGGTYRENNGIQQEKPQESSWTVAVIHSSDLLDKKYVTGELKMPVQNMTRQK